MGRLFRQYLPDGSLVGVAAGQSWFTPEEVMIRRTGSTIADIDACEVLGGAAA